jgi:hypothetical protein
MNDSPVRWLANGSAAAGSVSMNNLRGKSWVWTSNTSKTGFNAFNPQATVTDSSGYVYSVAYGSSTGLYVVKTSPVGNTVWITRLSPASGYAEQSPSAFRNGLAVSSSGNVYVAVGHRTSSAPITYYYGVAKLNSSGTLQWSSYLAAPASFVVNGSLGIDSSENVYVWGFADASTANDAVIAKYNSSGTLQWQKKLAGVLGAIGYSAVSVDATNNYVYVAGFYGSTSGFVGKYDTNLSLQWGSTLDTAVGCAFAVAATNPSNQNVYVSVRSPVLGIAKFNSSGTLQWQKQFSTGSTYSAIAVDSSDNAYIQMDGTGTANPYILKISSSGAISSQLQFSPNGMSFGTYNNMGGVAVTGNAIATTFNTTTSSAPVNGGSVIKLLNTLNTTGTYGRVIISSSSVTASDSTYTAGSSSPTISTTSFTQVNSLVTGSDVTSTFTNAVTLI